MTDLPLLVSTSSLAQKQLRAILPITLGYRADVGAVGGRLIVVQIFHDRVLIRALWLEPRLVWRLLAASPEGRL